MASFATITTKRLFGLLLFIPLLAQAGADSRLDERFLHARDAWRNGERVRLTRLAEGLAGHPLRPWADYWLLRLKLDEGESDGVREFLEREKGSYLAEKLRGDWLKLLGKQRDWANYEKELAPLVQPDQEIACYSLQARLARQDAAALAEARPVWFSASELPESCLPPMDALAAAGRLSADDVWERVRRLLEVKKLREARLAMRHLPDGQAPKTGILDAIAERPARHLAHLPADFAARRADAEMALFAVQRLARQDPLAAAERWRAIEEKFSAADRGYAWGQIAWQGALRHLPETLGWYTLAGTTPLLEEQLAWKARAALRAGDWALLLGTIEQMPQQLAAEPAWTYWLGRALAEQGRREEARKLFAGLSGQPNFYGNLADDELGRPITVPPRPPAVTAEEIAEAAARPGFARALALFRVDMRIEGIREWIWTLRGMDDRQLLAAAEHAWRHDVYDRAINTADRTLAQHDFALRFPAPFRERVDPRARELALDQGWVYGLMRQESRFITSARSGAGAKGLMQLMPATAKWVAKKIGLPYHPARVTETDVNVTLGTHYLKMVLASLDNHPVLASAAYNAGPGRARKWRAERPLEGAVYAETIPFGETRDYVKKVMSNAVYYAALFENRPQSLKSRLGTILPARGGEVVEELP